MMFEDEFIWFRISPRVLIDIIQMINQGLRVQLVQSFFQSLYLIWLLYDDENYCPQSNQYCYNQAEYDQFKSQDQRHFK